MWFLNNRFCAECLMYVETGLQILYYTLKLKMFLKDTLCNFVEEIQMRTEISCHDCFFYIT